MGWIFGEIKRVQLEDIAAPTPALKGRIYIDSTTNDPSMDDGAKIHKILTAEKQTPISLANATGPVNVPGLVIAFANFHRFEAKFAIRRRDDSAEQDVHGTIVGVYKLDAATWDLQVEYAGDAEGGQPAGTTFTITAGGQVQSTTIDFNGGVGANYAGYLVFDIIKKFSNFAT